jgi:FkbM family methyltransferase
MAWRKLLAKVPFARKIRNAFRKKSKTELIDARDNRHMSEILKRVLKADSHCVDIGAHRGDVLKELITLAPNGQHFGIEAIPTLAMFLKAAFPQATIFNHAVGEQDGEIEFQWVVTNPAFSGIQRRLDLRPEDRVELVRTQVRPLDAIIPEEVKIDLLKIDVEGGELGVLRGAARILGRDKPITIFEHGSAAAVYGTTSRDVYDEFAKHGMGVWRMDRWLEGIGAMNAEEFSECVASGDYWNFVAGDIRKKT